ncbi:MAG: Glycerol-3-phosphate cytidylyltransferase [Aeromicrobium sp.]|jgi:glycerol-3-phosphate cytidylyltransferase|nr:Glycerol-3-phosphate cytidylyltransferase [Aeromicrobium sp.]
MKVITYGTFDLFHEGHRRLLRRARELGDYLIVAVTTEGFDDARGKLNVRESLMDRLRTVQESGLADEVIIEEYEGQKIHDIQRYGVDIFAIGSDWLGKFDYLNDYCKVVYLDRTKGVSSTELRNESSGILRIGAVGSGRIAHRFVDESRYVSGVEVASVYSRTPAAREAFAAKHELEHCADSYQQLLDDVAAVYVATPHPSHASIVRQALEAGRHVLCEKPLSLSGTEARELFALAESKGLVLLEALKTAFAPGFQRMVAVARSGSIGDIRSVDATFTKLVDPGLREFDPEQGGGSISELASYPLLAVLKLIGTDHEAITTHAFVTEKGVDEFARIDLRFPHAIASARTGIGVKAEGDLVVAGTRGQLYVPAPWWKTEYFETRFEDARNNKRFYFKFDGDGLRYEIAEFGAMIRDSELDTFKLRRDESIWLADVIESARSEFVRVG